MMNDGVTLLSISNNIDMFPWDLADGHNESISPPSTPTGEMVFKYYTTGRELVYTMKPPIAPTDFTYRACPIRSSRCIGHRMSGQWSCPDCKTICPRCENKRAHCYPFCPNCMLNSSSGTKVQLIEISDLDKI